MINIIIDYSYWFVLIIAIIAILYSYILYRKDKSLSEVKKYTLFFLRILRFTSVFLLLLLLLNPLLKKQEKHTEKPAIVILQDNSLSCIYNADSTFYKNNYINSLKRLKQNLSANFNPIIYTFGNNVIKSDSISFIENKTDIAKAIKKINKLYINRNLGAIILASDGIYNTGLNPEYLKQTLSVPIYTVLLGDSLERKDVVIKNVVYNKDVFLGNNFPIEVFINTTKLEGKRTEVQILNNNNIISTQKIVLSKNNKINFKLTAKSKGLIKYKINVKPIDEEENITNNTSEIVINIIDSRKKILLLANSPHPDVFAIQSVLANSSFYEIHYQIFNKSIHNIKNYDLVIFHQLPSNNNSIINIIEQINNFNISSLFIVGAQTDLNKFNALKQGFSINYKKKTFEETAPNINKDFSLFTINNDFSNYIEDLPPLISYFANYKSNVKSEVLFTQKIKNIETNRALFMFLENNNNRYRSALISGEGIWRWRMYDFKENENFDNFNTLINKTIQYLTANLKENPLSITYNKISQTNNNIMFNAQFINKSFELINNPELSMQITNNNNKTFNYIFDKTNNKYQLNINGLKTDVYKFTAKLKFANEEFITNGSFSIINKNLEAINTVANHKVLRKISLQNNGKSFYPQQLSLLEKEIVENSNISTVNYYQTNLTELINSFWFFLLIIIAISLEWFIRKYSGSY